MKTKWMGLWAQDVKGYYSGYNIKKSDIPKQTRLVVRYNKYYQKGSKRPRFVYCFADETGYEEMCVPVEIAEDQPYIEDETYYTADGDRLYTEDEVRAIIEGTLRDAEYGITDAGDILPSDFV